MEQVSEKHALPTIQTTSRNLWIDFVHCIAINMLQLTNSFFVYRMHIITRKCIPCIHTSMSWDSKLYRVTNTVQSLSNRIIIIQKQNAWVKNCGTLVWNLFLYKKSIECHLTHWFFPRLCKMQIPVISLSEGVSMVW